MVHSCMVGNVYIPFGLKICIHIFSLKKYSYLYYKHIHFRKGINRYRITTITHSVRCIDPLTTNQSNLDYFQSDHFFSIITIISGLIPTVNLVHSSLLHFIYVVTHFFCSLLPLGLCKHYTILPKSLFF